MGILPGRLLGRHFGSGESFVTICKFACARTHRMHTQVLRQSLESQYLDCFSVQSCRAVCSDFCCVREERNYLTHTARSLNLEPSAIFSLFFVDRLNRYPLPELVLQGNIPYCTDHEDPRGFYLSRHNPCSCVIIRRRQIRLEELFWQRQLTLGRRTSGLLRGESFSSTES